jgi:hypothetical protein
MIDIKNSGYYPLDRFYLDMYAPSHPGVYTLSVRAEGRGFRTIFTGQSENLYRTLRAFVRKDPSITPGLLIDRLEENECFFSFLVIMEKEYRNEVEKMLTFTADPVSKLKIVAYT